MLLHPQHHTMIAFIKFWTQVKSAGIFGSMLDMRGVDCHPEHQSLLTDFDCACCFNRKQLAAAIAIIYFQNYVGAFDDVVILSMHSSALLS